jgi:Spy/CpxP family protein refolding chaperone
MKRRMIPYVATAALAAGLAFANPPSAPSSTQSSTGQTRANRRAEFHERMAKELNLTDQQRAEAKTVFQQAKEKSRPYMEQLRADRQAMREAVKSNDTAKIHSLAAKEGKTRGEIRAINAEAMAKFYAGLTPEQRTKADQLHQQARQRMHERMEQHRTGE